MSLSRAELQAMDRDELIDAIVELSGTVEDLQETVDIASESVWTLEDSVYGEYGSTLGSTKLDGEAVLERLLALEVENERLRERVESIELKADAAVRAATSTDEDTSQTDRAKHMTRNLLVLKAARDAGAADRPVTIDDIQTRAEPDHDLKWQTVRNAWDRLLAEWPQFYETTDDGAQALSIRPGEVSAALAATVQADLERDDLTKRFVGENGGGATK